MINANYDELIQAWIEKNKETVIQRYMDLIRVPSVRSEAKPGAPFGEACAQAVKLAASYFEQEGFQVRLDEENRYALVRYGEGEKSIGVFGHSDVVPVGEGWKFTQPFEPVIIEDSLIGRGSCDNKSGVIASLCVMQILRDCNIPLKSRYEVFIGSNEESGMGDITAYREKEQIPDLCIVPDSAYPCSLGEKGILRCWARSDAPLEQIRGFEGGNAFNVVLDRTEVTLSPNPALQAQIAENLPESGCTMEVASDGTIQLQAKGVAKHAGSPDGGVNAAVLAAKLLVKCPALPEADRKNMQAVADLFESPFGEGMGIAHTDPDFGRLTAVNGMVKVEDGHLWLSMDIRYGVSFAPDALEEMLDQVWGSRGFEICQMNNRKGFNADPNSFLPGIMCQVYQEVTGVEVKPYRMAGGTYARYLPNAFPTGVWASVTDRKTKPLQMPAGHGGAHQKDERIDLVGFFQSLRVMVHAMVACDEALNA